MGKGKLSMLELEKQELRDRVHALTKEDIAIVVANLPTDAMENEVRRRRKLMEKMLNKTRKDLRARDGGIYGI